MATINREHQEQLDRARDLIAESPEMGFMRSLFLGRLEPHWIIPYPRQDPDEATRTDELLGQLDHFLADEVDPDAIDAEESIPRRVIEGLGQLGVLGMTVPREYGGGGFSHTAYCRVLERIARRCSSTAVFVGAHQSIGLKALVLMGTHEQKQRFLPALASGKLIAAFCLSEPEVGSDAASVQTRAGLSADGSSWILNGEKKFATNAAVAGMMTVMAQTPVQENGKPKDRVTAFIVTPDMRGFEVVSPNRSKCGICGTWQATLRFTDMRVPRENVLGEIGRGLKVALGVLDYGRCTLSAGCVGSARVALQMSIDRARSRQQFGKPIGKFDLIKQKIARMAELVFAMDAMTYLAAGIVDRHDKDIMLETAICKLFCSEAAGHVIDDAMQIWGGEGYMRSNGLERMYRDSRINRIVEGTTEVMTTFIALMGMKAVGERLEEVVHAARHPIEKFDRLTSFARHEWQDLVLGHSLNNLSPYLADESDELTRLTRMLARDVERLLRKYGKAIIDMQLPQQRIAWSVVDLFAMAAVISKLQLSIDTGDEDVLRDDNWRRDMMLGKRFCHHAARRIREHHRTLFNNSDDEVLALADVVLGYAPPQRQDYAYYPPEPYDAIM